jgi:hypothetical protein
MDSFGGNWKPVSDDHVDEPTNVVSESANKSMFFALTGKC